MPLTVSDCGDRVGAGKIKRGVGVDTAGGTAFDHHPGRAVAGNFKGRILTGNDRAAGAGAQHADGIRAG